MVMFGISELEGKTTTMPRIPKSNPRYRTKSELCGELAFVLNSNLHYGTKHAVLLEATWVWTEFEGKYEGCEHWSEAALEFRGQPQMLIHEHVIPKKVVIELLLKLPNPTTGSVHQLLESFCKGVVITKEEDTRLNRRGLRSKMPSDWDGKDLWARYTVAKIVLKKA
jgi:hypothetical protein